MKTVRNLGLLTAAAALAFTFTPVFGFSRANADEGATGAGGSPDPTQSAPAATAAPKSSAAAPANSGTNSQDSAGTNTGTQANAGTQTAPGKTPGAAGDSGKQTAGTGSTPSTPNTAPAGTSGSTEPVKPGEKENVTNPYYLTAYEEDGLLKKVRDANTAATEVTVKKGVVTLKYSYGSTKTLRVEDLIKYKYRADGAYGDKPELPRIYNSWDITSYPVDVDKRENRELQFFRGETCGNSKYTVKLENAGAKGVDGVKNELTRWSKVENGSKLKIFANSVAYVKKNTDGTPYVKIDGLPQGMSVVEKPGHEYSTGDKYNPNTRPAGQNGNKPKPDDQPYQHWGFKICGNPVAAVQPVGEKKVNYTVYREGSDTDYTVGTQYIGILPWKEKYDPQRDDSKNASGKPFVTENPSKDLTEDKIKSFLTVKYVNLAKGGLSKEPREGCTVGGKQDCHTMNNPSVGKLPDETKLQVVDDLQKLKPGVVSKVTVRVLYPDNQTEKEYLRGNPDGDSVDYVDIYVKLKKIIPWTELKPAQKITSMIPLTPATPNPKPQPKPQPQPPVKPNPKPGKTEPGKTVKPKPQPGNTEPAKPKPENPGTPAKPKKPEGSTPAPKPEKPGVPKPQPNQPENPDSKPKPKPVPDVIPGDGNGTPEGYVTVTFDPKDKTGGNDKPGGGDKPAPHEPETKATPQVIETPSSGESKVKDPQPTPVKDPNNLTPEEKQKVREEIKKSNPDLGLPDDKIHVGDNGEVTIYMPDNSIVKIPPVKGVSQYADPEAPAIPVKQPGLVAHSKQLPSTGANPAPAVWTATALLLIGVLLTLRSRSQAYCVAARHQVRKALHRKD